MDNNRDMRPDEGAETPEDVTLSDTDEGAETSEDLTLPDIGNCQTDSEPASQGDIEPSAGSETSDKNKLLKVASALYDYAEIFALSIIAVIFIFSFCIRLCRVDGSSMKNTLQNDEPIIATNLFYSPKQGDIIVFHLSNDYFTKPLVKRVIATEGQTVEINMTDNVITVDGEVYTDEHAYISDGKYIVRLEFNKEYIFQENGKTYFRATVPDGKVFVLGDNRNGSSDSRSEKVGFIDADCILGRAVLRLSPFTVLTD